jgi:hypothetical protein
VRGVAHVADAALRVSASQPDEPGEETRQGARARQAVLVHAQPQIAVRARRIGGEQPAVDVAHRLRVPRGAVPVAVLLALPGAVAQRGRQPEVGRAVGGRVRPRQCDAQQRVDALELEVRGIARGRPPDIRARLKHDGRRISRIALGQCGEVRRRALEGTAI